MERERILEMIIRPARVEDIPGMCDLLQELFSIESGFAPDPGTQIRGLTMLLNDSGGSSLVAVAARGGEIVGMGTVQLVISTAQGGASGVVEDIIVRKDLRGTGVASRILSELEDWSKKRGASRLQLLADRDNMPALHFYSRKGWILTNLICLRKFI